MTRLGLIKYHMTYEQAHAEMISGHYQILPPDPRLKPYPGSIPGLSCRSLAGEFCFAEYGKDGRFVESVVLVFEKQNDQWIFIGYY